MLSAFLLLCCLTTMAAAKSDPWTEKYGSSIGDLPFSGITSFAHLPHIRCLDEPSKPLDVAILGMPFDTAGAYLNCRLLNHQAAEDVYSFV